MNRPIVELSGLSIGPAGGGAATVIDVDLQIMPRQLVGLAGRSGSGKTTLALSLIGQIARGLAVRTGTISVFDVDPLTDAGARELRGHRVTYLGQDPAASLNPGRRIGSAVTELIRLRSTTRLSRDEVRTEISRLMNLVQLPDDPEFLRRFPHQVSGGQAQRIAIVQVMAGNPDLLILDEPTSALDPVLALEVREVLRRVTQTCAAVIVSHDLDLLADLASTTLELDRGRVISAYSAGELPRAVRPSPADGVVFHDSSEPPAIEVRNLSAYHGRHKVLNDVSLEVAKGECLAIVGPSGSGKSTLARCLVGLHRQSSGTLLLDGRDIDLASRNRRRADQGAVALVAQNSAGALNPKETVGEAIMRPLRGNAGLSAQAAQARLTELLQTVSLPAHVADRHPNALSGGERQRINLSRALAAGPRILVCDEVTSALDAENTVAIAGLLTELRRELGIAVVLVTHDLSLARHSADRVAVMRDGCIVEQGATAETLIAPTRPLARP